MGSIAEESTLTEVEESELPEGIRPSDLTPVEDVTSNLEGLFRGFSKFDDTFIIGAVSDHSPNSDHLYFSLRAAHTNAEINCVVWQSNRADLDVTIESEMIVAAKGNLKFFQGGGYPSLEVTEAHLVGESAYWHRVEQLTERLADEGLFDDDRKESLPAFPETVGVVTAAGSDAEQDIVESIQGRYPDVDILVHDSAVQGKKAPGELEAGIEAIDASPAEVLVVARGGGSETALRVFNEEPVVRALADADTPTVSAIGHDADTPLTDDVADVRVKTPTAAGEAVVVDKDEYRERIETGTTSIEQAYRTQVNRWVTEQRTTIDEEYPSLCERWFEAQQTLIDDAYASLVEAWREDARRDIERTYVFRAADWLETNEREIQQRADRLGRSWLRDEGRAVQSAYTALATDWVDTTRASIRQETARIEREHTFDQEKSGLERRNTVLVAIIVLLVLLVAVLLAVTFGLI